jgi:hypothetical protein
MRHLLRCWCLQQPLPLLLLPLPETVDPEYSARRLQQAPQHKHHKRQAHQTLASLDR